MGNLAILCVDDEKVVLNSMKDELKSLLEAGMILELAESGDEALEIVEEFDEAGTELAVVISDQIMPGMKGHELLIQLHKKQPNTIKILLTGQADADAVGNAMNQARLYRYIAKPWQSNDLTMTVTEGIKKYRMDSELQAQSKLVEDLRANATQGLVTATEIELSDEELYDKVFFERFLHFLPPEAKQWVIQACIGVICVDGKVDKTEMIYVQAVASANKSKDHVQQVVEMVKAREVPRLNVLKVGTEMGFKILNQLIRIVVCDEKISKKEAEYILYLGGKLGLTKQVVLSMIELSHQKMSINKKTESLFASIKNLAPEYSTYTA
ncbi:MAG: response regulator [SAR324 cluster bacterium]|nr:response regulator [SAR324 cluster bacterium]